LERINFTMVDLPVPKRSRVPVHDLNVAKNVSFSGSGIIATTRSPSPIVLFSYMRVYET
jgi:hypothetical protein